MSDKITEVGRLLKKARRVLIITGAGVSAESGIPTFRGAASAFPDGKTEEGLPFEVVLSASTFLRKPALSWKYFFQLELSLRGKQPNPAHFAMVEMETPTRSVCVATQNVDGLHQTAGSSFVVELHGNLRRIVCAGCDFSEMFSTFEGMPPLPRCRRCSNVLRPDAVLYEEAIPRQAFDRLDQEQRKGFDLVFSVGTTSLFYYVTEPVFQASRAGIPVVEINPDTTPVSAMANFRFSEAAGTVLPRILQASV